MGGGGTGVVETSVWPSRKHGSPFAGITHAHICIGTESGHYSVFLGISSNNPGCDATLRILFREG